MRAERTDNILLKTTYLDAALMVAFQVLGLENAVSLLFTATFPLTLLLWLRTVRRTLSAVDLLTILTVAVALISLIADALLSGAGLLPSVVKKWIMLTMTLLFFCAAARMQPGRAAMRFVGRIVDGLTAFLILCWLIVPERCFCFHGQVTDYLTFGFSNPNLAGMFLTCLYLYEIRQCRGKYRLLRIGICMVLVWLILLTRSRNSILVMLLCTLTVFVPQSKLLCPGLATMVAWLPAIFAGAYLLLAERTWVQRLFRFITGEGKALDSRMSVWTKAGEWIISSPLTGAAHALSATQLHNSHLDLAACYGIPALILVCILMSRYARNLAFACCFLLGLGESALFSGGLGIYLFAGLFLLKENCHEVQ